MKNRKGLSNSLTIKDGHKALVYRLYDTNIVTITINGITLNSGGWRTNHTKNCMNDNLPEGYKVKQKNFDWFLETPNETIPFTDNMSFSL